MIMCKYQVLETSWQRLKQRSKHTEVDLRDKDYGKDSSQKKTISNSKDTQRWIYVTRLIARTLGCPVAAATSKNTERWIYVTTITVRSPDCHTS